MSYILTYALKIFEMHCNNVKLFEVRVRKTEWGHSRFFYICYWFLKALVSKSSMLIVNCVYYLCNQNHRTVPKIVF